MRADLRRISKVAKAVPVSNTRVKFDVLLIVLIFRRENLFNFSIFYGVVMLFEATG